MDRQQCPDEDLTCAKAYRHRDMVGSRQPTSTMPVEIIN